MNNDQSKCRLHGVSFEKGSRRQANHWIVESLNECGLSDAEKSFPHANAIKLESCFRPDKFVVANSYCSECRKLMLEWARGIHSKEELCLKFVHDYLIPLLEESLINRNDPEDQST